MSQTDPTIQQLQNELAMYQRQRLHEAAAERIRVAVLSMFSSDDLLGVLVTMWREMQVLGLESPAVGYFFVREAKVQISSYMAFENPTKHGVSWSSSAVREVDAETVVARWDVPIDPSWDDDLDQWRAGEVWSTIRSPEQDEAVTRQFHTDFGLSGTLPFIGEVGTVTNVPFKHGWIALRHRGIDEEHLAVARQLIEPLSLGYLRSLDFTRLEDQNQRLAEALEQLSAAQSQMLMQEKMASLGNLVAGVVHELNTPIGAIQSSHDTAQRALRRVGESLAIGDVATAQPILRLLSDADGAMAKGVERVVQIVDSLRDFTRLDEAEYQMADLRAGLESALTFLQPKLGEQVEVIRDFEPVEAIYCSPARLNQVYTVVLTNALEAIEDAGEIRIRVFDEEHSVCVRISDTGVGIPSEQLGGIFDVGFSTNGQRVKMRAGMATAYTVVQEHEGQIDVESEVGQGTTVTIRLPRTSQPDA